MDGRQMEEQMIDPDYFLEDKRSTKYKRLYRYAGQEKVVVQHADGSTTTVLFSTEIPNKRTDDMNVVQKHGEGVEE